MARGTPHSDETKAAVLAALLAGQSVHAVADDFHVSPATVRAWRVAAGLGAGSPPVHPQKRTEIGDLIADYLQESLITLSVQQQHFRDRAWLAKQGAADLAVLHGVIADKTLRLLTAIEPADESKDSAGDTP